MSSFLLEIFYLSSSWLCCRRRVTMSAKLYIILQRFLIVSIKLAVLKTV